MNRFICDSFYRTLDRSFEMRHSHSNHRSNAQVDELAAGWVMRRASGQLDLHFKGTGVDLSGGCRAGDMAQIQHLWARDVPGEAQTHGRSWKNTDYFDEQMLHKQVLSSWVTFQTFFDECRFTQQHICISCLNISLADAMSIHFLVWNTSAWTVSVQ